MIIILLLPGKKKDFQIGVSFFPFKFRSVMSLLMLRRMIVSITTTIATL